MSAILHLMVTSGQSNSLTVSVDPVFRTGSRTSTGTLSIGPFTSSVSGGVSPYTYQWSVDDFIDVDFSAPTSSSTFVSRDMILVPDNFVTAISLSVRDSAGNTGQFNVSAEFISLVEGGLD